MKCTSRLSRSSLATMIGATRGFQRGRELGPTLQGVRACCLDFLEGLDQRRAFGFGNRANASLLCFQAQA
jgi:hypothetical protein